MWIRGLGFWTPGFASPGAWCAGTAEGSERTPEAALLTGTLRRRATSMTRMALEAFGQATGAAGIDPAGAATVWATAFGEQRTALRLLAMLGRGEGKLSPTHFHQSVHNTAGGAASIATGNTRPSTTLTGASELVATALLEAGARLDREGGEVVVVLADEPLQAPFNTTGAREPLSLAFVLSAAAVPGGVRLSKLRREAAPPAEPDARFAGLHVAAALPLLEAAVRGQCGVVSLELAGPARAGWVVDVAGGVPGS